MKKQKVSYSEIKAQLHLDFLGKDAYRGVTFSYSWLCNQFGHFSIGFILAYGIYKFVPLFIDCSNEIALETAAIISASITLIFEIFNFSSTIYSDQKREGRPFKPDTRNLLSDLFTDMLFFWFGALVYYMTNTVSWCWQLDVVITLIFSSILFYFGRDWYSRKIYQQHAFFPFSLRLGQVEGEINEGNAQKILQFIKRQDSHKHLLIYGPVRSKNNGLAVAIGNELAIKLNKVHYTTMVDLMRMFHDAQEALAEYKGKRGFWTWREVDYLVVDHIHPGNPTRCIPFIPSEVYKELMNDKRGEENQESLKNQSVIWVLGDIPNGVNEIGYKNAWKKMLIDLEIAEENILEVDLKETT